jgi:hypothetical protein
MPQGESDVNQLTYTKTKGCKTLWKYAPFGFVAMYVLIWFAFKAAGATDVWKIGALVIANIWLAAGFTNFVLKWRVEYE